MVVTPNYQAAETVPLALCEVTGVALDADRDWALDLDEVAAAIRPNTRVVSVNFPNNPTGKVIGAGDFTAPGPACATSAASTCSATRSTAAWNVTRPASCRRPTDLSERALSLNVTSKSLGLPGLRIGWITCRDRALRARLERAKHYTTICNSAPSEVLARIALKARETILRPQPGPDRGESAGCSRRSSPSSRTTSSGRRRTAGASPIPATSAPKGWRSF